MLEDSICTVCSNFEALTVTISYSKLVRRNKFRFELIVTKTLALKTWVYNKKKSEFMVRIKTFRIRQIDFLIRTVKRTVIKELASHQGNMSSTKGENIFLLNSFLCTLSQCCGAGADFKLAGAAFF